jgi:hypothetical protein
MSGQWPPDWGDPDDDAAEAGRPDAEAESRQVTAFLAALPDPVLPDAVEARIGAAIAAAAAERAETGTGRTLGRPPRRAKVRRRKVRPPGKFAVRLLSSAAACVVVAGFGYLLTQLGGSPASSSAISEPAAAPAASSDHRLTTGPAFGAAIPSASAAPSFVVRNRGDVYEKSTLARQVRQRAQLSQLATLGTGTSEPTAALVGCVYHVTKDKVPSLVDEATYAGTPVYVIATSSRAWVVGRGCTATNPELITSVSLAGLPGISAP